MMDTAAKHFATRHSDGHKNTVSRIEIAMIAPPIIAVNFVFRQAISRTAKRYRFRQLARASGYKYQQPLPAQRLRVRRRFITD